MGKLEKLNKKGSVRQYRANANYTCKPTSNLSPSLDYQELADFSSSGRKRPWIDKKAKSMLVSSGFNQIANLMYPVVENEINSNNLNHEYYLKKAETIRKCGFRITFKRFEDNSLKLHQALFCKQRLCPMCSWRRSLKIFSQVSLLMNTIQAENDYDYLFLTLTVKNVDGPMLSDTLDNLIDGYLKLIRKTIVKKTVKGAFRAIEITYNRNTNMYHPHIHVVLCVNKDYFQKGYISNTQWSDLWKDCMDLDYQPLIDIRKTYGDKAKSIAEVAKYATKDDDLLIFENNKKEVNLEVLFTLDDALANRRLISYSGIFKQYQSKLNLQDPEDGDLVHIDDDSIRPDLSYTLETYSWRCGTYSRIDKINKTA